MIIARDDEAKRSKIWRIVTSVTSVLIVLIVIYLLTKLFTTNPLEGNWADEDGSLNLNIRGNGEMIVHLPEIAEGTEAEVPMSYTMDKDEKTISISADAEELEKLAEKSEGLYTADTLENALGRITTSFDYSVDQEQLTLTEREYGEQLTFIKE